VRPFEGGADDWDRLVLSLPRAHVLQSSLWGDIKSRWGWSVHRLTWGAAGREWAVAQALVRPVAGGRLRLAYVPRGPIVRQADEPSRWRELLGELGAWARRLGVAAVKIDPGVPSEWSGVTGAWRAVGCRPTVREVQFPNTMVSDLTMGEEGLLAAMKPKTRYNVRLAGRRGVKVREGSAADLDAFHRLYRLTAARGGFAVRSWEYYRDAWTAFLEAGWGVLLMAERDGQALAGCLPVAYGPTAWFLYGASSDVGREHMPSHLAQWESLRWAVRRGCRTYDWWGGPTRLDPDDPMWGVYQFKRGFGALLVQQTGAWDLPAHRGLYAVFRLAETARSAWLDARSRAPSPGA
jgi:peptidoglycan pentaglycine glycine transferase (the first glycine)